MIIVANNKENGLLQKQNTVASDDTEREVWEFMTPAAWYNSVGLECSIFASTYEETRRQVEETAKRNGNDVIIEVGCGTGDVVGLLKTDVPCIGIDINQEFVNFCAEKYQHDGCDFYMADALELSQWWQKMGFHEKYKKPLVTCVNNTLNIMPENMRGSVVEEMLTLAGPTGLCLVTYWNGNFFSHAVLNYYKKNKALCGSFEIHKHVDWERRILVTPSNYSTEWHTPPEVQQLLRSYDVDVPRMVSDGEPLWGEPHVNWEGLAVFVWFDQSSTSRAKGYYDSDDAQKFYNNIWGEDNLHVGRYDLLTSEQQQMPTHEQVALAQQHHEVEFMKFIQSKVGDEAIRIVDLGSGYGGLLRRLWKEGLVWHGTGVDISARMCHQARLLNTKSGCDQDLDVKEESFLDISMLDESADLVISMDALLHVGPDRQRRAMKEAARVLRPGGWIIFSDIMQEDVLADATKMQPIYDRINLTTMGTVSNYQKALEDLGFTEFSVDLFSENVPKHYGAILEVLSDKGRSFGISDTYIAKASKGLDMWKTNAPGNIAWGFVAAQKTKKVEI
jgi:sarcosine/dimethylglycine N-methyltransferase